MNIKCSGHLIVSCSKCKTESSFDSSYFVFDEENQDEREDGTEKQFIAEAEVNCKGCNNLFEIEYEIWEYPEGILNYQDITIRNNNAVVKSKFRISFIE